MNAAKMTLTATVVAAALGLALGLMAAPAGAHHKLGHNKGGDGGKPNSESSGKVFPVKVTFDDMGGDSIQSDGGPYIDGVDGVRAEIPVHGSPPGKLLVSLEGKEPRTFFIDFGAAVDCEPSDGLQGCVFDDSGAADPVVCPFPVGEREDANGTAENALCSGLRQVTMTFHHALDVFVEGDEIYMLGMPNDSPFDGESNEFEFGFRAEKNAGGWRLRFDELCLGFGAGKFLEITATDHNANDDAVLPNDEWQIGTGGGMKTACLTKTGKGRSEDLIGLFDMEFVYTVCILADPDMSNLCIGE